MTYNEFQRQLGKAGLTISEFALLVRMNRNSISNCSKGNSVPSHLAIIATLMAEMAEKEIDFRPSLTSMNIKKKSPRGGARIGAFGGKSEKRRVLFTPRQPQEGQP